MNSRRLRLTWEQLRFAQAYIDSPNKSAAAKAAGYDGPQPARYANTMLADPQVKAEIQSLLADRIDRHRATADKVIATLAAEAFRPGMSRFLRITEHGFGMIDLSKCSPEDLDAIASYTIDSSGKITLKLKDTIKPLELLAKHLGLVADPIKLMTDDELKRALEAATRGGEASGDIAPE